MPHPAPGEPLGDALHARVLAPYKPDCRYVTRTVLTQSGNGHSPRTGDPTSWVRFANECFIGDPCYIAPTGHFNAVEFNITYNQMLYLGLAEAVRRRLVPELAHWTLDDFFRAQLPDVLIGEYHARFARPMRAGPFQGYFSIVEVRPRPQRRMLLLNTHAVCTTAAGGECEARVTIALVNWQPA
ncbi:MAG: hypothetical protein JNK15_24235 [Planctomycetes bacterium]|nr:hypothetical protein [Planctomycetota bacterium]